MQEAALFQALPYIDEQTTIILDDAERKSKNRLLRGGGHCLK